MLAFVFLLVTGRLAHVPADLHHLLTSRASLPVSAEIVDKIVPHRAIYNLKLADTRSGSDINNAGGRMVFIWGDACEGWTVEQRLELAFTYNAGGSQLIRSSLATWEAKPGDLLRYSVRRSVNNKTEAAYQGEARLASDGAGTANYTMPAGKIEELQAGTLFPTVHTLTILEAAKNGERQLTRNVFDGADKAGQNQVTAFIGNPVDIKAPEGAARAEMRQGRAWPVQLAFFAPDNKNGMPDYEMKMTLLENGVANDLLIDYGDFTVSATLHDIEPMPKPAC